MRVVGKLGAGASLTLRQVHAICELKKSDAMLSHLSDQAICKSIIGTAKSMGISVVDDVTAKVASDKVTPPAAAQ